jgi:hypothetical protein
MWAFGKTEWVPEDSSRDACLVPKNTVFGECSTFPEAIDLLYGYVEDLLKRAEMSEASQYEAFLAEMRVFRDDLRIRYNTDMWEDAEFCGRDSDITYFVTN